MNNPTFSGAHGTSSDKTNQSWNSLLDLSNILSALAPLIGTGILYLIGWAYVSSWYTFFGISTAQVTLPIPLVLTQSISPIGTAIVLLFLVAVVYSSLSYFSALLDVFILYVVESIGYFYANAVALLASIRRSVLSKLHRSSSRHESLRYPPGPLFSFRGFALQQRVIRNAWQINIIATLALTSGLIMWAALTNPYRSAADFVAQLRSSIPSFVAASVFAIFTTLSFLLKVLKVEPSNNMPESFSLFIVTKRKWVMTFGVLYSFLILMMARGVAFSDAAMGKKGILLQENVQDTFIVGPKLLGVIPDSEIFCDSEQKNCIYGPFGLIAENDKSFFLVRWNANSENTPDFSRESGLYVIPRDGQDGAYFLLPEISTPSPTPAVMPNGSATPSPVITATPTATPH